METQATAASLEDAPARRGSSPVVTGWSLFSGAGGMDIGFEAAGIDVALRADTLEHACYTQRHNAPEAVVLGPPHSTGDVREMSGDRLLEQMGGRRPDVIFGGPPCQPFSVAANQRFLRGDSRFKRTGFGDARRGSLLGELVRLLLEVRPAAFCIENVPGLAQVDGGLQLREFMTTLRADGYSIAEPQLLQAADYGVPQLRERVFIVGRLGAQAPSLPNPTHASAATLDRHLCWRAAAQALQNFPHDCPNHVARRHRPESIERYKQLRSGRREKLGRVDRLDPRLPSKTVIAGGDSGGGRSHLHPFAARTMTVRECARLQTFPDEYFFTGPMGRQFTQVGNAVPPLLAEHVARSLLASAFSVPVPDRSLLEPSWLDRLSAGEATRELLRVTAEREPELLYDDAET